MQYSVTRQPPPAASTRTRLRPDSRVLPSSTSRQYERVLAHHSRARADRPASEESGCPLGAPGPWASSSPEPAPGRRARGGARDRHLGTVALRRLRRRREGRLPRCLCRGNRRGRVRRVVAERSRQHSGSGRDGDPADHPRGQRGDDPGAPGGPDRPRGRTRTAQPDETRIGGVGRSQGAPVRRAGRPHRCGPREPAGTRPTRQPRRGVRHWSAWVRGPAHRARRRAAWPGPGCRRRRLPAAHHAADTPRRQGPATCPARRPSHVLLRPRTRMRHARGRHRACARLCS